MSKPSLPQPVKLVASVLTGDTDIAGQVCEKLISRFGQTDFRSNPLPFNFTAYYEKEIGENLFRHILGFEKLIMPETLPSIKLWTNELESFFLRKDGTRRVNIDPGYISLCHLILATCKNFSHRPYLRDGVYADMTLIFKGKTFTPLEWSFPDYASASHINLLNRIRNTYHRQLTQSRH